MGEAKQLVSDGRLRAVRPVRDEIYDSEKVCGQPGVKQIRFIEMLRHEVWKLS